jgi:hypothetical protein
MSKTIEAIKPIAKKGNATKVNGATMVETKKGLAVQGSKKVAKESKPKKVKVTILAEGVTGKQFRNAQLDSNKLYKTELKSASKAFEFFLTYFADFTKLINGFNANDIKPSAQFLADNRTESEKKRNTFSPYLYSLMVKRYYTKKA